MSPRNIGIIGAILIVLLIIAGAIVIVLPLVGNQQAVVATPTAKGGRTPTEVAAGLPNSTASTAVGALSPVPPTPTPASTPVISATVSQRLDISGPRRNVVNVTDLTANKSTLLFSNPGTASGMVLSAAWSPDGKRVLLSYNWNSSGSDYGHLVSVLNPDGSPGAELIRTAPTSMGTNAAYAYRDAIWSPDGGRIAVRYQYGGDYGIWLANADGTNSKRMQSSDIGDWPRYWSVDGRWVIGISSADGTMYGVSVEGGERVPFAKIKGIQVYNERYFPWRVTDDPKCSVSGNWYETGGAYWDCD